MRFSNILLLAAGVLALGACDDPTEPEVELDAAQFDAWDLDADAVLDQAEFVAGMDQADVFEALDEDATGFLDAEEFGDTNLGALSTFDTTGDDLLSRDEFNVGTFLAFDTDENGEVTRTEFVTGVDLL